MQKHHRSDVTAIHHDALVLAHALLLSHQGSADKGESRYLTDSFAHLHRPDFLFYQLVIQVGVGLARLLIELERNANVRHALLQGCGIYLTIGFKQLMTQRIERHGAVHSTRVYIDISQLASQIFGHGTLAT